jgi:hypothetical protein
MAKLPVSLTDGLHCDERAARAVGEELAGDYCFAEPFPHIVIDDFLPTDLAEACLANFPLEVGANDTIYKKEYSGHFKRQVYPGDCSDFNRKLFAFFNSAPVLQFLEGLTVIPKLLSDPYFEGGGFHEISRGGKLGIHADFRIHERLNLQRRINMLIYLNKDWQPEWGGELELWDRGMTAKVRAVAPLFNRCVIFSTDADSYHGHPEPLQCPPGVTRKSIALYYYTASERLYEDVPADSTMYRARPGDGLKVRAQASKLRAYNHVKDWLPPVLFRALNSARIKKRG